MKLLKKLKTQLVDKKKQREQEKLIEALKRPENERRRPAMKFANNTGIR